jgi:hypothetical protein
MGKKMEDVLQWHPAFSALVRIELENDAKALIYEIEFQLTRKPLAIDMLVIKKDKEYESTNEIASFFREHNIMEYKSPGDYYSVEDFYKSMAYAGLYLSNAKSEKKIDPEDITVTVVSGKCPLKVMKTLKRLYGTSYRECVKGIYRTEGTLLFPTQFVVNTRLDPEKFIWLSRLRDNLELDKDLEVLAREYKGKENDILYETGMDVIMRANEGTFRRAKNMCNALRELFAEELEESRTNGEMRGIEIGESRGEIRGRKLGEESGRESAIISNLKSLMDSMKWTIDQAMDALKVPEDQRDHYRKAVQ